MTIPGSLTALLDARLDSLSDLQRAVLQRGSIEGQVFHRGAVSTLLPRDLRSQVASSFGPLMQKEFIAPGDAELAGEDAFRFRHLLIKDAAYRALPKETRAELHERLADWLADVAGLRLAELEEIVAYHLEAAFRYREELMVRTLPRCWAVARLRDSRRQANGRANEATSARRLPSWKAAELGDPDHPDRVRLLLRLAAVAESGGQTDLARKVWREIDARCPPGRMVRFAPPSWSSAWTRSWQEPIAVGLRRSTPRPMSPSRSLNVSGTNAGSPGVLRARERRLARRPDIAGDRRVGTRGRSGAKGRRCIARIGGPQLDRSRLVLRGDARGRRGAPTPGSLGPRGRSGGSGRHGGRRSLAHSRYSRRRPRSQRGCGPSSGALARARSCRPPRPLRESGRCVGRSLSWRSSRRTPRVAERP